MFLRLYFLLPNETTTQQVVADLKHSGIDVRNIHAHVKKAAGDALPEASRWQKMDLAQTIEKLAWGTDLLVFFIMLVLFITALLTGSYWAAIGALLVMALTFFLGDRFAVLMPRVHLTEFEHALSHDEVLLMVDVPKKDVADVEQMMRHYPAAIPAGSSWTIHSLGI